MHRRCRFGGIASITTFIFVRSFGWWLMAGADLF
jgi:hypothetical protein